MHWHRAGFWSVASARICKAALELYMHGLKFVPCLHFTSLVRCTKPSFYESISNRRSTDILWSPEKLFPQGRTRLHFFCILLSITIVKAHLDSISASASLFSAQWLQRPDLHTVSEKKKEVRRSNYSNINKTKDPSLGGISSSKSFICSQGQTTVWERDILLKSLVDCHNSESMWQYGEMASGGACRSETTSVISAQKEGLETITDC